jgi:AraC-like DNA-binding protein
MTTAPESRALRNVLNTPRLRRLSAPAQPVPPAQPVRGIVHPAADDVPWLLEAPWILSTGTYKSLIPEEWSEHAHREHCLIWSESGTVTVEADEQFWMVAPGLGIWVPAGTVHRVTADSGSLLSITYFHPERMAVAWVGVTGISLTGVVRELMLHNKTVEMPEERRLRLQALTVDLLMPVETASLTIRLPTDPALREVADAIIANPSDDRTSTEWAESLRISTRTLSRGFLRETGSTLTQWRILVRIRAALIDIAAGMPVAAVARNLGYSNRSAFIDLFTRTTGHAPAAYFQSFKRGAHVGLGHVVHNTGSIE